MHRSYTWKTLLIEVGMIILAVVFAFPVFILINLALRPASDTRSPLIPSFTTLQNFIDAWSQAALGGAIINSLIVTIVSTVVIVFLSALAAYPLSRVGRRWSKIAYWVFLTGLLLPFQLALIPLYTTIRDLGLLGNLASLMIFYIGLQMPFSIFVYAQFLRSLPTDYEEAGMLDGAGTFRVFASVVFPLMRPVTGTVAILNAIFVWNDFFTPLLYLSGSGNTTIPVALYQFTGQYSQQWNLLFAGIVIAILPILAAYFAMQRRIIQGFAGGLKG
jgi:raffinose/stachyose/melibiose transport system permease protein